MPPLPPGLTHPYDATGPRCVTYSYGHTFTWVRGDSYVSVQRGRMANACRVWAITDPHPDVPTVLGRHPIHDWFPAPPADQWRNPTIITHLAQRWAAGGIRRHRETA